VWLAPSINLHRNPLNGRNTEYFSEDPMLTGIIARNVVTSVGDAGLTVCCKHFAGNDQEQFRRGRHTRHSEAEGTSLDAINTITSERALREITLKPFELAVRTGKVYSVMSAFNKINGQYCSSSRELLTDILRGEWGFRGFVVTDWGDYDEIPNGAKEMAAGNDVIMSGVHTRYSIAEEVFAGIADGTLKREQLLNNAENLLRTILHSKNIFADGKFRTSCIGESEVQYHKTTALQIKTTMMPPAIIGRPYEELKKTPMFVSGDEDTTRYTWSISPNSAVSAEEFTAFGLTLHGNGSITGCAKAGTAGEYDVTFRVTSDLGYTDKTLSFSIREITIMPEVLPEVRLGIAYSETIQAFCGEENVRLSVQGQLPKGLRFDAETGLLSGMPEEAGMYEPCTFTIFADGETVHGERTYQLRTENYIDVAFTPAGGITVEAGSPIRIPFKTTRGIHAATYEYALIGAPEGIHLAGMRFIGYWIEGVLLQPGVYTFALHAQVEDSLPAIIVDAPYTITVLESGGKPLSVDGSLPYGKVAELYTAQIGVSGGEGVKKFTLLPGKSSVNLPADFCLSETGEIRCAPQASESGLYSVCVQVTDEIGSTVEAQMDLYIAGLLTVEPQPTKQFHFAAGETFSIALSAAGGFNNQFSYRAVSALPAGVELLSNTDYTGTLRGSLNKGSYRIVIEVDEVFGGSPVTTVVYYDLIIE